MKNLIITIGSLIYIILLINRISYLAKIYRLDIAKLRDDKIREAASMRTKMIREGTMRYSPDTARGIIGTVEGNIDNKILRRKLKFRHELINSLFTSITHIFKN